MFLNLSVVEFVFLVLFISISWDILKWFVRRAIYNRKMRGTII
jgi:hypothetical protein